MRVTVSSVQSRCIWIAASSLIVPMIFFWHPIGLAASLGALMGLLDYLAIEWWVRSLGSDEQQAKKSAWLNYGARFTFCAFFLVICLTQGSSPIGLVAGFTWHKLCVALVFLTRKEG